MAIGILYIISVVVVLNENKNTVLAIAGIASFLTILVPMLTTTPETTWMAYVNRLISVVGIWTTAFVVIKYSTFHVVVLRLSISPQILPDNPKLYIQPFSLECLSGPSLRLPSLISQIPSV